MNNISREHTLAEGGFDANRESSPLGLGFSRLLGLKLYKIAVDGTPYDTGNLVYSISLRINTPTRILVRFPGDKAHYLSALEEGTAPHGKHEGFIKYGILPDFARAVADYYLNELILPNSDFDRRKYLSEVSKLRGHGSGRVTIGRSRHNKDTRAIRRQQSIRMARGG